MIISATDENQVGKQQRQDLFSADTMAVEFPPRGDLPGSIPAFIEKTDKDAAL